MRDVHSEMQTAVLIANATYAADTTPVSVDLQGYNAAEVLLDIGAGGITFSGTNKIEFVLTHSDDDSTYSNVATADVLGAGSVTNGIIKALTAAHATGDVTRFGYIGGKRYLRLLADFSGTHGTGTPIGACVLLMKANLRPQADQA
jgi:hypothetical protein